MHDSDRLRQANSKIDDLRVQRADLRTKLLLAEEENNRLRKDLKASRTALPPEKGILAAMNEILDGADRGSHDGHLRLSEDGHDRPRPSSPSVDSLKRMVRDLRLQLDNANLSIGEAESRADAYKRDNKALKRELRSHTEYMAAMGEENHHATDTIRNQQQEMGVLRHQLDDALNLANTRGKELIGSQVFLSKADSLSVADIMDMVERLNHEIFQAAAHLGDSIKYLPYHLSHEEWQAARSMAERQLGPTITNILVDQTRQPKPTANPFVVQVVGQVVLSNFCAQMVQSWYPAIQGRANFLSDLYKSIRATEETAVSGRWRAITRSHTTVTSDGWDTSLFELLNSVVKIAAWQTADDNKREIFEGRLSHIFQALLELRDAIGKKYTSADLEVAIISSGRKFDKKTMEDAWGEGDEVDDGSGEAVAGTTGIGLKVARKGDTPERMLVSPKVVLDSTLRSALI